jgi:para-nitrobenzyl esterase
MIVETTYGRLRGAFSAGVHAFKNIPYGAPTSGANRFRPPARPQAWSGVREATAVGPISPQAVAGAGAPASPQTALFGPSEPLVQGEDCLNLNVFTQGVGDGGKRPVMVWFHGGGLTGGSGNARHYDGGALARRGDVVVVSVTHRLGALGYLNLGDLLGSDYATSGNSGFLDLVAALEWVRDNIAAFGGDPDNVTIFGESGGGWKVSFLLGMPAAKGLFHKAIIQSGPGVRAISTAEATANAETFLAQMSLGRADARKLMDLPFEEIAAAQPKAMAAGVAFNAVADGAAIPASPFDPAATPLSDAIPVLIGTMRDEMALFLIGDEKIMGRTLTMDEAVARATRLVGEEARARDLVAAYAAANPGAAPAVLWIRLQSDSTFVNDSVLLAERKAARAAAPVYMYQMTWESPALGGRLMACHGLDTALCFDNARLMPGLNGGDAAADEMARIMSSAWTAFARTGVPAAAGLPAWPTYDAATRATMILDKASHIASDPGGAVRRAWLKQMAPA